MDLLLINSPLFERAGSQQEDSLPPLGLGYLATAVRDAGFQVELFDSVAADCGTAGVLDVIGRARPRFVGINVFSTNLELVRQIVCAPSDSQFLIGGPAVRSLADTVLGWETDKKLALFIGEVEHALPAFLGGQLPLDTWQGRADRWQVAVCPTHALFPGNVDLPLERAFFRNEPLVDSARGLREVHIITGRGCGHDCAFCAAARSVSNVPIRFRTVAHVARELDEISARFPEVNSIRVLDDLFIRNRRAIERACKLFRGRGLSWRAMAHVNAFRGIGRDLFQELRQSGCRELFMGVESGSPQRRRAIGKPSAIEPTLDLVTALLQTGIEVKAYFIFGFPGESEQEMQETYGLAKRMAVAAAEAGTRFRTSVFKFRPYHGTRLYNELVESGANVGKIAPDFPLAAEGGRRQFSFASENYSGVDVETLNKFIHATRELGDETKPL